METEKRAVLRLPSGEMFAPSPVHSGGTVWQVAGDETGGAYTIYESILPPGRHISLHKHANDDEAFYIIEGEITFQLGDETLRATAGTFVFVPRGLPHSQLNTGQTDARRLIIFSPPGFERYFAERAALARSMGTLNPATHTGLDAEANDALAKKYGMTFLSEKEPG
jgi:quercetin dioxygenase-like cupin family protein